MEKINPQGWRKSECGKSSKDEAKPIQFEKMKKRVKKFLSVSIVAFYSRFDPAHLSNLLPDNVRGGAAKQQTAPHHTHTHSTMKMQIKHAEVEQKKKNGEK